MRCLFLKNSWVLDKIINPPTHKPVAIPLLPLKCCCWPQTAVFIFRCRILKKVDELILKWRENWKSSLLIPCCWTLSCNHPQKGFQHVVLLCFRLPTWFWMKWFYIFLPVFHPGQSVRIATPWQFGPRFRHVKTLTEMSTTEMSKTSHHLRGPYRFSHVLQYQPTFNISGADGFGFCQMRVTK